MKNTVYFKQAELLLKILPYIQKETDLALKGGTAINFFIRNLPRLSVDIDLTYLPVTDRNDALAGISNSLLRINETLTRVFPDIKITPKRIAGSNFITALIAHWCGVTVKIEPNLVMRGAVYPSEERKLSEKAQQLFEMTMAVRILSFADLYAGKICAALDRQHPRDFYDIKLLFDHEGFSDQIRKAFIVYLIGHPRPMVELLNPHLLDMREIFDREFVGLTLEKVSVADLVATRNQLIEMIKTSLTMDEKKFLLSVKNKEPEWELLGIENVQNLPAVKWKLINLGQMKPSKHKAALQKLRDYLEV